MKKGVDPFVFLPDDILLDILKKLPAVFLRFKAKYVCRRWFNIITKNILFDDASFILQKPICGYLKSACLVDIREAEQLGLEVKEKNLDHMPFVTIKSWYNEFLLITDLSSVKPLSVFNLITNKRSYLPECHTSCSPHVNCRVALCFDGFKGVYKVVHFLMDPPFQCHVLTLGREIVSGIVTSNWKKMKVDWEIENMYTDNLVLDLVHVQGRYLHCDVHNSNYLVSVDIEKERIFKMSLPMCSQLYSIFEMGGFLALINRSDMGKADIWILKDIQRMKWEKLHSNIFSDFYYNGNYPGGFLYISDLWRDRYEIYHLH